MARERMIIDNDLLVRQCCKGDHTAIEMLITKYQDRVYNLILKICQNHHDALELTQDTFVKVLENIGSFKSSSNVYTWIYRIAVNLTLNYCKRRVKIQFASLESSCSIDENSKKRLKDFLALESSHNPSGIAEEKEIQILVMHSLEQLSDEQRVIIVLRDIEGLCYEEIANVLNLELGTVKSRLSRSREALKELLESLI